MVTLGVLVYMLTQGFLQERVKDATSEARGKSNPFERINKSIFINRAATKLAALDATFGLTRTQGNEVCIWIEGWDLHVYECQPPFDMIFRHLHLPIFVVARVDSQVSQDWK